MLLPLLLACAKPAPPAASATDAPDLRAVSAALEQSTQELLRCETKPLPERHLTLGDQASECPPVTLPDALGGQTVQLPLLPEYFHPAQMRPIGISWLLRAQAPGEMSAMYLHLLTRDGEMHLLGASEYGTDLPHVLVSDAVLQEGSLPMPAGLEEHAAALLSIVEQGTHAGHALSHDECSALFAPWQCAPDGLYSSTKPTRPLSLGPEATIDLLQADALFWDTPTDRMAGITLKLAPTDFAVEAVGIQTTPGEHPLVLPHPGAEAADSHRTTWCELSWPWSESTTDIDRDCMNLLLAQTYEVTPEALQSDDVTGYDPGPFHREARYTAADLQGMRDRVAALCPAPDFDADRICARTLESIDLAIARKTSLQEDINMMGFGEQLCRILDGEQLTEEDMFLQTELRWSDLTRDKMKSAVLIRQGYQPVSADQKALFLSPASDDEAACLPAALPSGNARLPDDVDEHNLDLIDRSRR